jgi:hypothetical protein
MCQDEGITFHVEITSGTDAEDSEAYSKNKSKVTMVQVQQVLRRVS